MPVSDINLGNGDYTESQMCYDHYLARNISLHSVSDEEILDDISNAKNDDNIYQRWPMILMGLSETVVITGDLHDALDDSYVNGRLIDRHLKVMYSD